ncbi:hypothetical protein DID88_002108 [Monilinia fructigena]|uniref:C2H2-type domain-containing protein n=1 Tax=Monilinia fructigena TaxID=38457 RepID=A0A395IW21_9HELO|nr:hypothetical protein DID88_002108 [Monilinia fructigena]
MFNKLEGGNISEDDDNLSLPGPGPVNSAEEASTAGHTKPSSGKISEDPYSLNEMNSGSHKCHYTYCDKEFPTKQGLVNHSRVHFTDEQKHFLCPHPGCERRYISKKGARYHYGIEHGDRSTWPQCLIAGCLSSFYEPRALKLHQVEHGIYCCTGLGCDYRCYSEEDLSAHRRRNHPEKAILYKNRVSETRLNGMAPRMRQKDAGSMMFPQAGHNHCTEENDEDDEDKDEDEEEDYDEGSSQERSFNWPKIRHISNGWECPAKGCKAYRKFKYNLHSHWQDKHPNLSEPSDIASMIITVSGQSTEQHPASFLDDSHLVRRSEQSPASGTLASTHQPVHHQPAQIHSRQPLPNNTDSEKPSTRFKRESTGNMNNLNAKTTTSTPSVASSRSPMIAVVQARTSTNTVHPYNPLIPPRHHGAPNMHQSTAALVNPSGNSSKPSTNRPTGPSGNSSNSPANCSTGPSGNSSKPSHDYRTGPTGNSSIFPSSHPANNSLTKTTCPATHRAANPSAPKATNSLMTTGTSLSSGNRATPNDGTRSQARTRPRTSFRSSPLKPDNEDEEDEDEDDDEEESLFVSPTDNGKMQRGEGTGSNTRVLGVRGFANMPLPRDQDSDEQDLRPSHILRQERRAAAGKSPYYPPGARDSSGRLYGIEWSKENDGKTAAKAAADQFDDDSDDDDEFDNSLENTSSEDSFKKTILVVVAPQTVKKTSPLTTSPIVPPPNPQAVNVIPIPPGPPLPSTLPPTPNTPPTKPTSRPHLPPTIPPHQIPQRHKPPPPIL